MTNIYLYGELRNLFGHEFRYNISKPKEAFTAINANRRGFLTELKKLASKGVFYRIVIDDQVVENVLELEVIKEPKEIHLVPVVWGAGDSVKNILLIVAAVALIAISGGFGASSGLTLLSGTAAKVGIAVGAALLVQGVMGLLFPTPKADFNQEVSAGGKSYLFGSKPSNTSQGQVVPVGYGRLLIGSSQISASINNYRLNYDMRSLMTPTSRPTESIPVYDGIDEVEIDSYRANQSTIFDDSVSVVDVSLSQSYVDMITKSAQKLSSNIIELKVKQDGEIISNPALPTYDEELSYKWTQVSTSDPTRNAIQQINSYSFSNGVFWRFSRPQEFQLISEAAQNRQSGNYMVSYPANSLVVWGPSQFERIPKAPWSSRTSYILGEIVSLAGYYYQCSASIPSPASISTASRNGSTVTITTASNHGFSSGLKATINNLSKGNVNPNGSYAIAVTAANQFTYTLSTTDTASESYSVVNIPTVTLQAPPPIFKSYIASATRLNSVVTVVLGTSATPFNPINLTALNGTQFEIANLTGSPISVNPNGTYTITRVNDTTFTYTLSGSPSGAETYTIVQEDADVLNENEKSSATRFATNSFWTIYRPPTTEAIYRATSTSQGYLPTNGTYWTIQSIPTNSASLDTYFSYSKLPILQRFYSETLSQVDIAKLNGSNSDMSNYTLEFLGYFYIPLNKNTETLLSDPLAVRETSVISAQNGTVYEITKVGTAAQWSSIGVGAVTPVVGMTFTKNATTATGNGKVAPVYSYDFKIECTDQNDAFADLYINGILASSHDVDSSPTVSPVTLTSGYHRVYARFRAGAAKNKITISYRRTGAASYSLIQEGQLLTRMNESNLIPHEEPIYTKKGDIAASLMVTGKKYRINVVGSGSNWTSVGATSATVGTVFQKNSTAFSGSGAFVSEAIDISTAKADSQRLVVFTAERENNGYSKYVSFWKCEITKGMSKYFSPTIRVGATFLSTQTENIERSIPPVTSLPSMF